MSGTSMSSVRSPACAIPIIAAAALLSIAAGSADAAGWKKANIQWQYYAYGGPYDGGGSPTECKVRKNNCGAFFDFFNVLTDRSSITFDYSPSTAGSWSDSELSLPPTIYNGIAINMLSEGTIKSVKIDPSTNMAGFDSTRVSFTAKQIQVDWKNLPFDPSTIVKLNVKLERTAAPAGRTLTDNPPRLRN